MQKILVAEDDVFLANAYRVKLSKSGFDIKIATDGAEALAMIDDFQPDLLLLDLVMPNKDGFAVLETVRSEHKWQNLPIIIASNLGQQEDIDKAMKLGATGYIVKSNESLEEIIAKIKNAIASSGKKLNSSVEEI